MINASHLQSLTHSRTTNLKKGKINNHDATLLIIASKEDGITKTGDVIKQLQAWRGPAKFAYLWNTSGFGGYGFVGKDVNSSSNPVESFCSKHQRRTYWYRVKRGTYRLTLEGFRRLAELQDQLS